MAPASTRNSGWDPWLIMSQILALQSLHYLALCLIIPPLLASFADPHALAYSGGPATVAVIMDWREMSSRPTVPGLSGQEPGVYSEGKNISVKYVTGRVGTDMRHIGVDTRRGWCIAFSWLLTSGVDVYFLYTFVRKPRHILDFTLTLFFNHIILTTYYSAALPSSPFFWCVIFITAGLTATAAEQLCVRREMREGLEITTWSTDTTGGNIHEGGADVDLMELQQFRRD